jgi:hypothetical protein
MLLSASTAVKLVEFGAAFLGATFVINSLVPWKFVEEDKDFDHVSNTQKASVIGTFRGRKKIVTVKTKLLNDKICAEQLNKNMKHVVRHPLVGAIWWRMIYLNSFEYEISK